MQAALNLASMSSPYKALESFADQNPDLERLENLLKRFNLFEAVGVVRHELRHSDFLAFLLDPSQNHGLGATFLKAFLQAVRLTTEDDNTLSQFDLDAMNLSKAVVFREWHHVDILVVDDVNRFAVIIENKIGTGEHSDQLNRYQASFSSHYPGYKALALYLTPDGDAPTSDNYHAVSYTLVCEVIEKTAQNNRAALNGEIIMVLEHYAQMLRRHIVSDSDIAELCRSIYHKHRQALDVIFEHRPDQQAQVGEYVKHLIEQTPTLDLGAFAKGWIVFVPREWHGPRVVTPQPPHLYFEFHNRPNDLNIFCTLSPGDIEKRTKIFAMAQQNQFPGCQSRLNRGHCRLATIPILRVSDYEKPQEEIEKIISEKWVVFLRDDLPRMVQAVHDEEWLWEKPETPIVTVDLRSQIGQYVQFLIISSVGYNLYNFAKGYVNFTLTDWDKCLKFRQPSTSYAVFPYLTFWNERDGLTVGMSLGPGEQADREAVRQRVEDNGVKGVSRVLDRRQWSRVSSFEILGSGDYHQSWAEVELLILDKWKEFVDTELPKMIRAVREEKWLWELPV